MAFKLLDVDKFIQYHKAKQITTTKTFDTNFEPTAGGLQDSSIFGATSNERLNNWGYINLENVVFHPLIYQNLASISPIFKKVRDKKINVEIVNGELKENEKGGTGINFLITNWEKINFDKYRNNKNSLFIDFLKNTKKNLIFVDKVPVIPVAYREAHDRGFKIEEDEIDRLYKNLLSLAKSNRSEFTSQWMEAFKDFNAKETVQAALNRLYKYFIGKLEKKTGFFRSALIGKRLDNVARLVANARPDIPIDSCIIPWHVLLNIFDIYIAAYCQQPEHEDIAKKLSLYNKSSQEIGDHLDYIFRNVSVYVKDYPENQVLFIQMLTDIFNKYPDLRVLVKRDPGWNADSFWCFKPLINTELSYQIWVPAFVYSPLGGDSFNTNFFITTAINNVLFEDDKFIVKKTNDESSFIVKTLNSVWKKQNFQNLN